MWFHGSSSKKSVWEGRKTRWSDRIQAPFVLEMVPLERAEACGARIGDHRTGCRHDGNQSRAGDKRQVSGGFVASGSREAEAP